METKRDIRRLRAIQEGLKDGTYSADDAPNIVTDGAMEDIQKGDQDDTTAAERAGRPISALGDTGKQVCGDGHATTLIVSGAKNKSQEGCWGCYEGY